MPSAMARVLRRLRLMTLTTAALMLLAACGGGAPAEDEATAPAQGTTQETDTQSAAEEPAAPELDAATLRATINNALREHVFLAATATGAALGGDTAGFDAAAAALGGNSEDIAALVGSVYGPELQETFLGLWNSHIDMVVRYTQGIAAGDTAAADAAVAELTTYSQTLADTFDQVTAGGLPASASQPLILDHVLTLKSVIDKQQAGDAAGAFTDLRTAMAHMDMIAKPLAGAIATQNGIPGSVEGTPADLQAGLNGLLQEHVLLAGTATGNALGGNTAGFEAAAGAIGANTDDLAAAVGSVYPDVQEAFRGLWASHIDMVVRYTQGIAANDTAASDAAVAELTEYVTTLANTFEQVTGLPASASSPLILQHVTTLKSAIDAQKAGDLTAAYTNLRAAANHMHEIANPLAATIVQQQGIS
ncbi:MAG: hypothetical protein ACRDZO_15545 [Egibacteraceae bacterium]